MRLSGIGSMLFCRNSITRVGNVIVMTSLLILSMNSLSSKKVFSQENLEQETSQRRALDTVVSLVEEGCSVSTEYMDDLRQATGDFGVAGSISSYRYYRQSRGTNHISIRPSDSNLHSIRISQDYQFNEDVFAANETKIKAHLNKELGLLVRDLSESFGEYEEVRNYQISNLLAVFEIQDCRVEISFLRWSVDPAEQTVQFLTIFPPQD